MFLESLAVLSLSTSTLNLNKGPFPTVTPEMKRTQWWNINAPMDHYWTESGLDNVWPCNPSSRVTIQIGFCDLGSFLSPRARLACLLVPAAALSWWPVNILASPSPLPPTDPFNWSGFLPFRTRRYTGNDGFSRGCGLVRYENQI